MHVKTKECWMPYNGVNSKYEDASAMDRQSHPALRIKPVHLESSANDIFKMKVTSQSFKITSEISRCICFAMSKVILPFTEANTKRVSSLFRKALRTAYDSNLKFDIYRQETVRIRSQFDSNKSVSDPNELEAIISKARVQLAEYAHPDPYIPPLRPGGSKYERNLPSPNGPVVPGDW